MNENFEVEVIEKLTKIDGRLDVYNAHLEEHMRRSDALEEKVDELYKFKYYVVGGLALASLLISIAVQILKK
jgi:hypothetical protein